MITVGGNKRGRISKTNNRRDDYSVLENFKRKLQSCGNKLHLIQLDEG